MRNILAAIFMALVAITPMMAVAQDDADLAKRTELAEEMHKIRPVNAEIESTVRAVAERLPEEKREIFVMKMVNTFDHKTLHNLSVKAMADTFTEAELEKMIDYFGSPEGKSVGEKMPVYMAILRPEINKLIDQAMMDVRLGPAE